MNLSSGMTSMSSASWKSTDSVPDQFPAGMRVLVVDDDPTCLKIVEKMLKTCLYEVTTCNRAEQALVALQMNRNGFDLVISDVHMPDMNGFKLLELIGLEMDLPVIMMSADDGKSVVMKGVTHGACDYLIKPIRIEELKNIWQHVVRKRKHEWKEVEQSASADDGDRQQNNNNKHDSEDADYSSSATEGNWKSSKRRKEEEDDLEEKDDSSALKKPRVVWSVELHQQFVCAVNQLGIDKAVPKKILELMNVAGLTRENVASHLQKYRLYLRRLSGVSQHQNGGMNGSFISTQDATFGSMSSLNGLDQLQALAVSGQLPAQTLATLQAAGFGRSSPNKSTISIPLIDQQRNIFSFDNSKQQPSIIGNSTKQMNLLHGVPTTMEPKQLASLHQSAHQSFDTSAALLMQQTQMGQSQPHPTGPHVIVGDNSNCPSSISRISQLPVNQSMIGNGILSQARTSLSFPMSHHHGGTNLQGNHNSSFGSLGGLPNLTSDIKVSSPLMPTGGYYMLNELQQMRSNNTWQMQQQNNVGLGSGGSTTTATTTDTTTTNFIMQGGNLVNPSNLLLQQQGCLSSSASSSDQHHRNLGHIRNTNNTSSGGGSKVIYCSSTEGGAESLNSIVTGGGSVRIKSENVVDSTVVVGPAPPPLFPDHFDQEDLMSALLKQQDEIVPVNHEFDFDGYSIDNIPV